jgi:hypothetical protein
MHGLTFYLRHPRVPKLAEEFALGLDLTSGMIVHGTVEDVDVVSGVCLVYMS